MPRTIIAAGGLETAQQEKDFARWYAAVLRQASGKRNPTVCLLAQAQAEAGEVTARDKSLYESEGCNFLVLNTFAPGALFKETISTADGFMILGGSTINMLAIWQVHNLPVLLREAYEQGKPFAGYSAGALCWFDEFLTSDGGVAAGYRQMKGLGWLRGSFAPHYINTTLQPWRAEILEPLVASGQCAEGLACDDGVFAVYHDEQEQDIFTIVEGHKAYRIRRQGASCVRETIQPKKI